MDGEILYLTELLGLKVYDLKGRQIGVLRDAALVPLVDPVRLDRFLVGTGSVWLSIRYDQIHSIRQNGIRLKDEQLTPYHSDEYMLRMVRDLLDQQIIDAQGRKVVRVNDVTFIYERDGESDVLHLLEVDIGVRSIVRRLLRGLVPPSYIRKAQSRIPPRSIRWEFCNILEADPQRRVRLNISNRLLEDIHPADLADIVERLGHQDRAAIFDELDSESAAEILTEVEPELQSQIIDSLETEKAAGILDEMEPSDAAALLDELQEKRSEEILEEMEANAKDEVEELRELRDDAAARLMDTRYVALPEGVTVGYAREVMRERADALDQLYALFVVDERKSLIHMVPVQRLFFADDGTALQDLASDPLLCVSTEERSQRVAELFDKYNLLALPVVEAETRELVGVIKVDDVVTLLRQS